MIQLNRFMEITKARRPLQKTCTGLEIFALMVFLTNSIIADKTLSFLLHYCI